MTAIQKNKSSLFSIYESLMKTISHKVMEKNHSNIKLYCKQIISNIIYNEKAHIVATFKDFLIFDDTSEFLKRSYKSNETKSRLTKIFEYYDSFSKIFPNYTVLPEAKYIYKNIQRKQKMIDNLQNKNGKQVVNKIIEDKIFLTDIYNSIMNLSVSTMKNDDNQIVPKDLNLSIKIEDSNQSLEGLIDKIGKAEESSSNPVKYHEKIKNPQEIRNDSQSKIQSLLKNNTIKYNQINMNQFNRKIDLKNTNINTKQEFSPNLKLIKSKETFNIGKTNLLYEKNIFKSIQINDKLNVNSLLDSINKHPNSTNKKKESFVIKSSINDEKTTPDTERGWRINNEASHKLTLSIPKMGTNNIYNNINIINNFHDSDPNNKKSLIPYSQINIISEISPKTSSGRLSQKFHLKNVEKIPKKPEDSMKTKINTSQSVNSINFNKQENKNSHIIKLRKNNTKSNILNNDSDRLTNEVKIDDLKNNNLKANSIHSFNPLVSNSTIKLSSIKSLNNDNLYNSISLTKRDRAVSLTARHVKLYHYIDDQ